MKLVKHNVVKPDGKTTNWYVLERKDFAIIIALDNKKDTHLVGQFRFAVQEFSWEFPMGSTKDESPLETAKTELREETGYTATQWKEIGVFNVAPGHTNQKAYVFIAEGLKAGKPQPGPSEFLEVRKFPVTQVADMIRTGKILDGPTISAYHFLELYLFQDNR